MRQAAVVLLLCLLPCLHPANSEVTFPEFPNPGKKISVWTYREQSIPDFFKSLVRNHMADFIARDDHAFESACTNFDADPRDPGNMITYYTVEILHKLFTSRSCTNMSRGEILDIPYLWHWTTPNPRHEILLTGNGSPLTSIKHPKDFEKYETFADIDRTPYVYLTDLLAPVPKYCAGADTFSTFGWCSEREMAFVSLVTLMGYTGHVIAPGCHSWSELEVSMTAASGGPKTVRVTVDNTFDQVIWQSGGPEDHKNSYNRTAHSPAILQRLGAYQVPAAAMNRIESMVVKYLENRTALSRKG
jgi:hypothetical protein